MPSLPIYLPIYLVFEELLMSIYAEIEFTTHRAKHITESSNLRQAKWLTNPVYYQVSFEHKSEVMSWWKIKASSAKYPLGPYLRNHEAEDKIAHLSFSQFLH